MFKIQGSFSIADPDERLDKIMGNINMVNIKFDFDDPRQQKKHIAPKKIKHVVTKGKLEKIIVRALSNHRLAPNPYRKVPSLRPLTRSNSKINSTNSTNVNNSHHLPQSRSVSCLKQPTQKTREISKSPSALALSIQEAPYHITTLREAALMSFRISQRNH